MNTSFIFSICTANSTNCELNALVPWDNKSELDTTNSGVADLICAAGQVVQLKVKNKNRIPISIEKFKNLMELIHLIPEEYHPFTNNFHAATQCWIHMLTLIIQKISLSSELNNSKLLNVCHS